MPESVQVRERQIHPMRIIAMNGTEHAAVARIDEGRELPAIFQQIQTADIRDGVDDAGDIPVIPDRGKHRLQGFRIRTAHENLRDITPAENFVMKCESRLDSHPEIAADQQCDGTPPGRIPLAGRIVSETFRCIQYLFPHLRTDRPCPVDHIRYCRLGTSRL